MRNWQAQPRAGACIVKRVYLERTVACVLESLQAKSLWMSSRRVNLHRLTTKEINKAKQKQKTKQKENKRQKKEKKRNKKTKKKETKTKTGFCNRTQQLLKLELYKSQYNFQIFHQILTCNQHCQYFFMVCNLDVADHFSFQNCWVSFIAQTKFLEASLRTRSRETRKQWQQK